MMNTSKLTPSMNLINLKTEEGEKALEKEDLWEKSWKKSVKFKKLEKKSKIQSFLHKKLRKSSQNSLGRIEV